MNGVLFVEGASVAANSGHMLVTFTSGGDDFRFYLPAHVGMKLRETIMRDGWQVLCAPDAETVALDAQRERAKREQRGAK